MLEPIIQFFAAAGEALTTGAIDRGVDAISQLFLWFDLFESDEFNHWMNVGLGIIEVLVGTVLVSMGQRQLDFTDPADGEGIPRVARRTAGEVVETLLGYLLRVVGIVRGLAGLLLLVGSLL